MTVALSLACVALTCVVGFLVYLLRSTPDDPVVQEAPTPSPLTSDDVLLELIRLVRTQHSDAVEIHQQTLATLERIALPVAADTRPLTTDPDPTAAPLDLSTLAWDPTDTDPWLADPEFRHVADRPQVNDAPDIITHPLGIPGLTFPSPTMGEMRVNGSGGVVAAGVV